MRTIHHRRAKLFKWPLQLSLFFFVSISVTLCCAIQIFAFKHFAFFPRLLLELPTAQASASEGSTHHKTSLIENVMLQSIVNLADLSAKKMS